MSNTVKPLSNRGRDYLTFLRGGPQTEKTLRRLAAEATEDGTTHERFHAGRRPVTARVLPTLLELGFIEADGDAYRLTRQGEYLAAEVVLATSLRKRAERERRRRVAAEDVVRSYGKRPTLPS